MNVFKLPMPMFYAYMAGVMDACRDDWMRRAAQTDNMDSRRRCVRNAREYNHERLRYLALAREALPAGN